MFYYTAALPSRVSAGIRRQGNYENIQVHFVTTKGIWSYYEGYKYGTEEFRKHTI